MVKILAFAGSARKDSFNFQLVRQAALAAEVAGAKVTVINMADYEMPLYHQDREAEQGIPEKALAFKRLLQQHQGILLASPEYNSAFSPLLKNAIDWASRAETNDEPPLSAYQGKYAGIMSASPGALGGLRGLVFVRMLLNNIGVTVVPKQFALSQAYQAFDEKGNLKDPKQYKAVSAVSEALVSLLSKVAG